MADHEVRIRSWVRGSDEDARAGLIGYVSLFYGALILDGITVRRTAEGRLTLAFPERRDGLGRRHLIARPVNEAARQAIERVVFGAATVAEAVEP